jgi:patatin-like phospholipase domain-containing protein 2
LFSHPGLAKVLPADIHIRCNDRLHVSLTRVADRTNLIVSQFESREQLIDTLLASCFIPLLSGWLPPRLDGQLVFDGGYSDNVPVVQANTITVSPFSGNQDICPLDDSELAELLGLNVPTGSV